MSEPLIETLKEGFPYEVVNPFGEVIIVPSKQFEHGWETILTDQGYKVFSHSYNGESSFFIRVEKARKQP